MCDKTGVEETINGKLTPLFLLWQLTRQITSSESVRDYYVIYTIYYNIKQTTPGEICTASS